MKIGTTFVIDGLQKRLQNGDAWLGQTAGTLQPQLVRQFAQIASEHRNRVRKAGKTRIAANLADRAENADGAELLENVGVAEDGGFECRRFVFGLVLANDIQHGRDFGLRKTCIAQDLRCMGAGIRDVTPAGEFGGLFGTIPDKDAEVVQPGRGADHVAIVAEIGADDRRQNIQTRLVTKFVDRTCLIFDGADQFGHEI